MCIIIGVPRIYETMDSVNKRNLTTMKNNTNIEGMLI